MWSEEFFLLFGKSLLCCFLEQEPGVKEVRGKQVFVSSMGVSQGRRSDLAKFCNVFRCRSLLEDYTISLCSSPYFEISSKLSLNQALGT